MGYRNIFDVLSNYSYNNKMVFIFVSILIVFLIVDTSIIKIYYFSFNQSPVSWRVILFIVISSAFLVSLYLMSQFVKQRSENLRNHKVLHVNILYKTVVISKYLLTATIGFVIFQIVVTSSYNTIMLTIATWISYTTAIIMIGVLAKKFFSWFRSDRNYIVLLYGLSSAMLAINAAFILTFVTFVLRNAPDYVQPHIGVAFPFFTLGQATDILNYGYVISSIISFMLWWIATVSVLHRYSEKSRRHWLLLSIPLIYFLIQFQPLLLSLFSPFLTSQPVLFGIVYQLIFTVSKPVGGILFGVTFWLITRKMSSNNIARNYMILSAYGLILVFVSNQAVVLVSAPYPPFGLATSSFFGLSSYLLLIGIYSSAISVAEDSKLRETILKTAIKEAKFLHSIGTAHMEQTLLDIVQKIAKKNEGELRVQTGIESALSEDDMNNYIEQVIEEVKKSRYSTNNSTI